MLPSANTNRILKSANRKCIITAADATVDDDVADYKAETDLDTEGNQLEDKFNGKDTSEDHVQVIQDLRVNSALAIKLNRQTEHINSNLEFICLEQIYTRSDNC